MKRMLAMLCVLLVLTALLPGAAAETVVQEGQVTGHGDPEIMLLGGEAPRPTEDMIRTTAEGLEFIKRHEGFSPGGYLDNSQVSIGYGTSTTFAAKYGFPTDAITEEDAHALLVCAVYEFEQSLNRFLTSNRLSLADYQYDALISFTYNLGTVWLDGCRLSRHLVNGYTTNEFASAMGIWCHVGKDIVNGLVNRRLDEIVLFLDGAYDRSRSSLRFCTLRYVGDGDFDNDIDFYEAGRPYGSFSEVLPLNPQKPYLMGWYTADGDQITEQTVVRTDLVVSPRWSVVQTPGSGSVITDLTARDSGGTILSALPEDGFFLSAEVDQREDSGQTVLMLVTYTAEGQMLDVWFQQTTVPPGTVYTTGVWVKNTDGQVAAAKAFLLRSLTDTTPVCEAVELRLK